LVRRWHDAIVSIDRTTTSLELGTMAFTISRRSHLFLPAGVLAVLERITVGRRKAATAAAAVLAVAVGYHVVFGANGLIVYQKKRQETQQLHRQMLDLQHENALLKGHVDRLQSDPNAIEHQAREQLHYTRPGEVIYTLPSK
jgi:cell division protein FtsB